jgi:hypothetical protein
MEEKYLLEEELKEEKDYLLKDEGRLCLKN